MIAAASSTTRLKCIPFACLTLLRHLTSGTFGAVDVMSWIGGITVAVKFNKTSQTDTAVIDNEHRLYGKLLGNPHDNVLPVYGICKDAPDGKMRLVMKFCEKGSLCDHLRQMEGQVRLHALVD
jgi:hypothetical protein